MSKTRHREYMDAIKHTKKRLRVGMDYRPFLVCRALWRDAEIIPHLNTINRKPLPVYNCDTREQRLFEKQMHFDYLLSVASRKPNNRIPLRPTWRLLGECSRQY